MARAWVTAVPPGIHQAPQGPVVATPERIRGWHDKYQRMKALGIDVPVPWGHHPDALPGSRAKFNAGYLRDSRVGPKGSLDFLVDVPGAEVDADGHLLTEEVGPDGVRRKAAIREVSAGIRDWTDGQRRRWEDAVVHLALVTHPVVAGQKGFTAAADLATKPPGGFAYLSTASLLYTLGDKAMADETAAVADEPTPAEVAAEQVEPPGDEAAKVSQVLRDLAVFGIVLDPEGVDAGNLLDKLATVLPSAVHAKEKMEAAEADQPAAPDAPVNEESRPVMMSTLAEGKDPLTRALLEQRNNDHRAALAAKVNRLVKLGLPPGKAAEFRGRLAGYTLSLDPGTLAVSPQGLDEQLALAEELLKGRPPSQKLLSTLTEQPNPARDVSPEKRREEMLAEARRQAERVSVKRAVR